MSNFQPRNQIEYKAVGRLEHGFVERVGADGTVFCRFWHNNAVFSDEKMVLRTTANSEGCDPDDLKKYDYGGAEVIDHVCDAMGWA